ncbi:MAG: hypothetical protein KAR12_06725 [Methylococcales bacterium]|nr:hypothetical protein [Methylococcales bacterium]
MPRSIQNQAIPTTPLATQIGKLSTTLNNLQMFGASQARLGYLIRDAQMLIKSAQGVQGLIDDTK